MPGTPNDDMRYPPITVSKIITPPSIEGLGLIPGAGPKFSIEESLTNFAKQLATFSATQVLRKTMTPRVVSVGTTPVKVIDVKGATKGYLIINKSSESNQVASSGILVPSLNYPSSTSSDGSFVGVSNFLNLHLYLDITNTTGAGRMDWYLRSRMPQGGFIDAQLVFPDTDILGVVGSYYAYVGQNGVATDISMRWQLLSGTSVEFSVGYVLKEGLPGSASGTSRTIYLGGNNGVTTVSGFPLIEGQSWAMYMEQNSELWAVAETTVNLNIFELQ